MAERAKAKKEDGANSLVANLTTDAKRQKALEMAMEQIEKQFGKGAIMRLGQSEIDDIEAISTGSLSLDIALGIGGLPMGRIIEIYGHLRAYRSSPEKRQNLRFYRRRTRP